MRHKKSLRKLMPLVASVVIFSPIAAIAAPTTGTASTSAKPAAHVAKPAQVGIPKIVQTTCFACHGLHGMAVTSAYPNLAGQWPSYIEKQLHNFKTHQRADPLAPVMWAMAGPLNNKTIKQVAQYFFTQKPAPGKDFAPKQVAAGRKIYFGGLPSKGVPACYACHGGTAVGLPPWFPRLAGQRRQYVINQLTYFNKGLRTNDPKGMMRYVASRLSAKQIKALAAFVRSE